MSSKRHAEDETDHSEKKARSDAIVPASTVTPVQKESKAPKVDRAKRCPLLLRMFPKVGGHHKVVDYRKDSEPDGELSIHTWMDADLRELADLVKQTQSAARHRDARMEFALVFPDKRGVNIMRTVGTVHSMLPGTDDQKTLHDVKFQIGDFMDVAILVPGRAVVSGAGGRVYHFQSESAYPWGIRTAVDKAVHTVEQWVQVEFVILSPHFHLPELQAQVCVDLEQIEACKACQRMPREALKLKCSDSEHAMATAGALMWA